MTRRSEIEHEPRWVFERVGLFDAELAQDQDEELNQRIIDAGGRVRFDPSISAAYDSRATWQGLFRQYFRYGVSKVRTIQKRPRILRARHLVPYSVTSAALSLRSPPTAGNPSSTGGAGDFASGAGAAGWPTSI